MNIKDPLKQFSALRSSLEREKEAVRARLKLVSAALAGEDHDASTPPKSKLGRKPGRRASNKLSLKDAVLQSLSATPVGRKELLSKVQALDYRFATKNPLNSLQTFLYGAGKKLVKKVNGNFASLGPPVSTRTQSEPAVKPVKKRKMSAAGRKAIAAAQKARWAKAAKERK